MQIGVSSHSYSKSLSLNGNVTHYNIISTSKFIGFDNIEFTPLMPHNGMTKIEYARSLREHAKHLGIEISAYVVGAQLLQPDETATKAEIKRVCEELDVAAELGVKLFRHDACWTLEGRRSFDLALPEIAKNTREITKYAESLGIKTMTENHGYLAQGSERMEKLFNAVDHPNFGLLCDMGNFLCFDEDPVQAVARVAPYTIHVHAKDFIVNKKDICTEGSKWFKTRAGYNLLGVPVNEGSVPVEDCIKALKKAGYDGCINIEYEGELDSVTGIRRVFNNLKKILNK